MAKVKYFKKSRKILSGDADVTWHQTDYVLSRNHKARSFS
jgi:hypothetical protein